MVEKKAKTTPAAKAAAKPRGAAATAAAAPPSELAIVLERLEQLEVRILQLEAERNSRVGALTAPVAAPPKAAPVAAPPPPPPEPMTDEIMTVLAAAVAAFLGERAHVKQVRFIGREAWAQQGRAAIMASHRWAVHRS